MTLKELGQDTIIMMNVQEVINNKRRNLLKKTATLKTDIVQETVLSKSESSLNLDASLVAQQEPDSKASHYFF